MFTANYVKKYATYEPVKFERLEDLPTTNKSAQAPVSLLFLIRKLEKAKFNIPAIFHVPNTLVYTKPRKYQELQYRIQAIELRMEFYLHLFELFCRAADTIYNVYCLQCLQWQENPLCWSGKCRSNFSLNCCYPSVVVPIAEGWMFKSTRAEICNCFVTLGQLELMLDVL